MKELGRAMPPCVQTNLEKNEPELKSDFSFVFSVNSLTRASQNWDVIREKGRMRTSASIRLDPDDIPFPNRSTMDDKGKQVSKDSSLC